jgi:5'(3')-deoxyribonucleotidase
MTKKILYVDMDGVLCDYKTAYLNAIQRTPEIIYPQSQIGFFLNLKPLPMVCDMDFYYENFDTYILTSPSVKNPLCYTEKRLWIEKHLGMKYCDKLIISPNKTLNKGNYLIDDNFWEFEGKLLLLGSKEFPKFNDVFKYLYKNK